MMWNFCKKIANGMELQRQGSRKAACALWERWSAVRILIWVTAPMSKRSKSANKVLRDWQTLTAEQQRSGANNFLMKIVNEA